MNNPFISYSDEFSCEYLSYVCSLNRGVMAELPVKGVDDSIKGKKFSEIFSTKIIIEDIKKTAKKYGVDLSQYEDYQLPKIIDRGLVCDDIKLKGLSNKIAVKYGNRLGLILLALRLGQKENRKARTDWDNSHWEYWANLNTVILVGGLASSMFGRKLKEQIQGIFDRKGAKPYNIVLFENGTYIGLLGCANALMKDNETSLVFDFGHTMTKRGIVTKSAEQISQFTTFESTPTLYMQDKFDTDEEKTKMALSLHKNIVKIIANTYKEASKTNEPSDKIYVSIANYVAGNVLNDYRGGYAKLCVLGRDYTKILTEDISGELHKKVSVKLVHDGTATALYFSDIENSVCLSLGTSFGVGFPDIKI